MLVQLRRVTRAGETVYVWNDANGRAWIVYRSFHRWRFRRDDHDISSIGYRTLEDARSALERAFEETH